MYNNLSLYRDNGLQKLALGTPITLWGPNSYDYTLDHGGSQGGIPPYSNGTVNIDEVSSLPFNTTGVGGIQGLNPVSLVPGTATSGGLNTLTGTQIGQLPDLWSTSYTTTLLPLSSSRYTAPPPTPQFSNNPSPYSGTLTRPYGPLTLQGYQDYTTGQPIQQSVYVTPEGSFGAYGLDLAMQNPNSLTMTPVNNLDPFGYHFGPNIGIREIMDDNYSPTLGWIPKNPYILNHVLHPPKDIFTADYMLNNIAPSGAWGLGIGALAGALSGGHPVKTGLGAGVGAFGGKMLYDYLANNKDTKKYIQQFLDWASKNLWDGAGEHVQYLAPILGGLAGFAATK